MNYTPYINFITPSPNENNEYVFRREFLDIYTQPDLPANYITLGIKEASKVFFTL